MSTEPTGGGLVERLIRTSVGQPLIAIVLATAGTILGALWMRDLPRDVFPDLSAPVFNVIVQGSAMGAEELETSIAIPMESGV